MDDELAKARARAARLTAELLEVVPLVLTAELVEIPSLAERITTLAIERRETLSTVTRLTLLAPVDPVLLPVA